LQFPQVRCDLVYLGKGDDRVWGQNILSIGDTKAPIHALWDWFVELKMSSQGLAIGVVF